VSADAVRVVRPADVRWRSLGVVGAGSDRFGDVVAEPASQPVSGSSGFAAGFVDFRDLEMDFTVTYDEACYVIDGEIRFTPRDGAEVVVRTGEVFLIRYGTDVHVRVPDRCRIFYAVHPADWIERHPDELMRLGR
jgi:ethanolamine utilization protein EutQ (cupin superfamily)